MPEIEGTFTIGDTELYTKTWMPDDPVAANLIFFHGYSDHCNAYRSLFPSLAARRIAVYSLDQRGWGRSAKTPRDRGLSGPTATVLADMVAFIQSVVAQSVDVPVFVMGNSMGGGQILTLACTPAYNDIAGRVRGWLAEAPFIAFPRGAEPMALEVYAGRLLGKLLPRFQLKKPIDPHILTRVAANAEAVAADELCHDTGTLQGLAGMLDRAANLERGKMSLNPSVSALAIFHGSGDKVTSHLASRKFIDEQKIQDKMFKEYDGGYHQLHADLCADEFIQDVGDWILARLDVKARL
ncbi:hypothetical protein TD95_004130 [Thielaviopsis punctulata]|uniref:Serine aminopeptidase S33 domain-containing protein n=1 Tax=Thielaviopsis punctulata TaxID=72032 RepID=A0A0F4ZBG9_9PEZI|nr:hypothetical protein TD95_004130 [Thielaviopsis punctulata]